MYKTSLLSTGPRCQKQIQRRRSFTAGVGVVPPNQSRPQHKYNVASLKKKESFSQDRHRNRPQKHFWSAMCWLKYQSALDLTCILEVPHLLAVWYLQCMCEQELQTDTGLLGTVNRSFPGGNFSNKQKKTSSKWPSLLFGVPSCRELTRCRQCDVASGCVMVENVPVMLHVNGEAQF